MGGRLTGTVLCYLIAGAASIIARIGERAAVQGV